jgi:hypothetical protein
MIDFIYKFNRLLSSWQIGTSKTMQDLSTQMEIPLPNLIHNLGEVLGKEFDVTVLLSFDEAMEAFLILGRKHRQEIELREIELEKEREKVAHLYSELAPRITKMQLDKKWYQAFRTLSYFSGQHANELSPSLIISLCSEIVRSGVRCSANLQEVSYWLEKGITASLSRQTEDSLEEAFDLLDAYAEYLLKEESGRGEKIVLKMLKILEEKSYQLNKLSRYKEVVKEIFSTVQ